MIARAQRSLGQLDDAEKTQRELLAEYDALGETDGYVYEELAEIALARGDAARREAMGREGVRGAEGRPGTHSQRAGTPCAARAARGRRDAADTGQAVNPRNGARSSSACARPIRTRRRSSSIQTPFELLVAVVLSAQATDKGVNKATAKLFPVANTPAAIVALGVDGLIPYVQSIGLFRNKAKNIVALSEILLREHGGRSSRRSRSARKAAGRRPQDRQRDPQHRVRTADDRGRHAHLPRRQPHGPRTGKNAEEVEHKLLKFVPEEFRQDAHHWLILHGRYVCVARSPKCGECLILDLCEFREKNL